MHNVLAEKIKFETRQVIVLVSITFSPKSPGNMGIIALHASGIKRVKINIHCAFFSFVAFAEKTQKQQRQQRNVNSCIHWPSQSDSLIENNMIIPDNFDLLRIL